MSDDFSIIERQVFDIATVEDAAAIVELRGRVEALVRRAKEIKGTFDQQVMDWIDEHGEFEVEGVRWYVGTRKTDKPKDIRQTIEAIERAVGGDFDQFCACLSANPLKVGTVRGILGDDLFAHLFTTVIKQDLKTGKPERAVKHVDTRFIKSRTGTVPEEDET